MKLNEVQILLKLYFEWRCAALGKHLFDTVEIRTITLG